MSSAMSARGQNWFLRPARRALGWNAKRNLGRLTCPKICQEEQSGAKLSALNPRQQRTTEENRAGSSQEPLIWVIADQSLLCVPGIKYFIFSQSGLHLQRRTVLADMDRLQYIWPAWNRQPQNTQKSQQISTEFENVIRKIRKFSALKY